VLHLSESALFCKPILRLTASLETRKKSQLKLGTPPVERPDSPDRLLWLTPALHVPRLLAAVLVRSIVLVLALYVDQLLNVRCEIPTS
jgi:hypothetical protein